MATLLSELDLPEVDYNTPGFGPATYHRLLADARAQGWLAHSPVAYVVLDAEAGDFFLRSRQVAFPGRELVGLFGITSGPLFESVDNNIINATGDRHRRLRSLVGHAFTPREADKWRPAMRRFLTELWGKLVAAADYDSASGVYRAEFISGFGQDYPARVVAEVLGAPVRDAPRLFRWASLFQRQFDLQALATQVTEMEQGCVEAYEYVSALLDSRREAPAGDLISVLLTSSDASGDRLSHDELVNLVLNVIAGGSETTQGQLGHALRLFTGHPSQWALLAGAPERLAPAAVTEVLRFEPVSPFTARLCLADIEYRGVLFPAGTILGLCTERANREVPGGEDFDITASRDGKLFTFGAGAHYCLGSNLARAELEEALAFLAPRMPGLALDGEPVLGGIEGIYGVEALPLRWSAGDFPRNLPDCCPVVRQQRHNSHMPTHIALLRGINLGGRNKVAMADLRALVAGLGHTDVTTYIQSGNVLFTAVGSAPDPIAMAEEMSAAIAAKLGVTSPVIVVPRAELAQIIGANPFPDEPDPKRVHAVVLSQPPWPDLTARIEAALAQASAKGSHDEIQAMGRTLYLHTPEGYGRSDVAQLLLRVVHAPKVGGTGTARNWATMTKLLSLCEA
jgi:cytochrome P450/uncharacterized protein (DUF1697 family)